MPTTMSVRDWIDLHAMAERQPELALERTGGLFETTRGSGDNGLEARLRLTEATAELHLGRLDASRRSLERALDLLDDPPEDAVVAAEAHLVAVRLRFRAGEHEPALRHGHRATELAALAADPALHSRALNALGLVYGHMGAYERAIEVLGESLRVREEARLAPLGGPQNNLGNIHQLQNEPQQALDAFRAALDAFEVNGSQVDAVIALGNIGRALTELDEHESAADAHEEAVTRAREHGIVDYVAPGLTKWGVARMAAGDLDAAKDLLNEALRVAEDGSRPFRNETIHALAVCALEQGRHDEARRWVDDLLADAERSTLPQLKHDAHALASRVHEAAGDYRNALTHLREADTWRAQIDRDLFSSRTRALLLQLEMDRSTRERDSLRELNAELGSAYEELSTLHEKLQEQAVELKRLSLEDALTGLPNRRFLERRLADEQARIERYGGTYSLLVCDIDDFKDANDKFSHAVGDQVLERLGDILRSMIRDVDVAARYGGEEFVILLPSTGAARAALAAEKIRDAVCVHPWHELHPGLEITVSIGVAEAPPGASFDRVFAAADAQLYQVKRSGKNRVGHAGSP